MARLKIGRLAPRSLIGQMVAVLVLAFTILLAILAIAEQSDGQDLVGGADSEFTIGRLRNLLQVIPFVRDDQLGAFVAKVSRCHDGYALSDRPYAPARSTPETQQVAARLAAELGLAPDAVRVGGATLERTQFGYSRCPEGAMRFPVDGLVISVRLQNGRWLHAEVHPHEWHLRSSFLGWVSRSFGVFLLVAGTAILFMFRLGRPLGLLAQAARRFGEGLKVDPVEEKGPPDVRRTIGAFNLMQQQVADEIERRTTTFAALGHDLRTPLAGLRLKTELVEDPKLRAELLVSIRKMESIADASLAFLRGESLNEPKRLVDLNALVESEVVEFEENGEPVAMEPGPALRCHCRPDSIARAVRNLVENALKYGGRADVRVVEAGAWAEIQVRDQGPGIPPDPGLDLTRPFVRHPSARSADPGSFGLGLAVVKAVADAHDGQFELRPNEPLGLVAALRIPIG